MLVFEEKIRFHSQKRLSSLGILHGISALLLTFDEYEVRKIVRICQHVFNHLLHAENIESIDELVDFVQVNIIFLSLITEID